MQTSVDIANMALARIGKPPVSAFTDGTTQSELVRRFYPYSRDEVLTLYDWKCAKKRVSLAPEAVSQTSTKYAFQYPLPTDLLRVVYMYSTLEEDDSARVEKPWMVEGERLHTDAENIGILYISQLEDATKIDRHVADTISLNLATKIGFPLSAGIPLVQALQLEYQQQLLNAKMIDGMIAQEQKHIPEEMPEPRKFWEDVT